MRHLGDWIRRLPHSGRKKAISSIIIDGYNLIGTSHRDLNAQREGLIRQLAEYRRKKGHDITVVFDGWKSGGNEEMHMTVGGMRIIYSRLAEKADAVIKRLITTHQKEWIVVSSDRDIAAHAWSRGSVPVPAEEFEKALGRMEQAAAGDYDLIEESDEETPRRGNPRKLSRKDKALMRALAKL